MTSVVDVPFGEWLPDAPTHKNPGCVVADNAIPILGGYKPLRSLVQRGNTVPDGVQGAREFYDTTNDPLIVGGAGSTLFAIDGSGVTETSPVLPPVIGWDFCRFNNFVVATNGKAQPQYLSDIDTDRTWSDLPGSPPTAHYCAKVLEHVFLGNITGYPYRLQWSSYNSPATSWARDRLTQAGYADLDTEFGQIQRIIGGRFALVFQERGVQRLSQVSSPVFWRADPISREQGTPAPFSVVQAGYSVFFLSQDGFYVTNGTEVQPISTARVNDWFFSHLDQSQITKVQGAMDWQNNCVVWAFSENSTTARDRVLIYSISQNRWATGTVQTQWLLSAKIDGLSLDEIGAIYPDLESVPYSLDAPRWAGQYLRLTAFANSGLVADHHQFAGAPLAAMFETSEFQPAPGRSVFISEIAPLMESRDWDARAAIVMRDNRGATTFSAETETGFNGFCPVYGEGKTARVQITMPKDADWEKAQGVQVRFTAAGAL